MRVDLDKVAAIIAEAAAEEITPRFGKLAAHDIREKAPNDLVTVADTAMEHRLTAALPPLLPGSIVVGEEAVHEDPAVQDRLDGSDPVWLIDPVDGTANFAAARPEVAVIVALVQGGETLATWIHDPLSGDMAIAESGQGAWMAGERLRVAPAAPHGEMRGSLNVRYFPPDIRARIKRHEQSFISSTPLFSAGKEYLRLARARSHFALFWRIKPWDHAAGILLHREAGGHSAKIDGSPYRPTDRTGGLLIAPDRETWQSLNGLLFS